MSSHDPTDGRSGKILVISIVAGGIILAIVALFLRAPFPPPEGAPVPTTAPYATE